MLFLVIILIFRKEISSLLKRVRQINVENNSSKISFLLSEMDNSINFQIRQYGEDLRLKGQLGSGVENEENREFTYYFNLIHGHQELYKELAQNRPFATIEKVI